MILNLVKTYHSSGDFLTKKGYWTKQSETGR